MPPSQSLLFFFSGFSGAAEHHLQPSPAAGEQGARHRAQRLPVQEKWWVSLSVEGELSLQIYDGLNDCVCLTSSCFCLRLRKVWQKRKCTAKNGYLTISHGTVSKHTRAHSCHGQSVNSYLSHMQMGASDLSPAAATLMANPPVLTVVPTDRLSLPHYLCRLTDHQLSSICSPVRWSTTQRRRGALT